MPKDSNKRLYNIYTRKNEKVEQALGELNKEREEIIAPFEKRRQALRSKGGKQTAEIQKEINDLKAQITHITKEYEDQADKLWADFYNDPIMTGKKEKLFNIKEYLHRPKSIAKRAVPVAGASVTGGIIAKLLHKKAVDEQTTEQYYLEHGAYPKEYVNDFVKLVEETKNGGDPEAAENASYFNIDGITPTNFVERVTDGLNNYADAVTNNPQKLEEICTKAYNDYGLVITQDQAKEAILLNKTAAIQYAGEGLYAGYDPSQMATAVADYTVAFAGIGAALAVLVVFSPYLYNAVKIHSFNKKYNAKKQSLQKNVDKLAAQKDEKIAQINNVIEQKTAEKDAVKQREIVEGEAQIRDEERAACLVVDLKIERIKAISDLYYNHYLLGMAKEGENLAVAKDDPAKILKIGKPERYQENMEKIQAKITKLNSKLAKYDIQPSALM